MEEYFIYPLVTSLNGTSVQKDFTEIIFSFKKNENKIIFHQTE